MWISQDGIFSPTVSNLHYLTMMRLMTLTGQEPGTKSSSRSPAWVGGALALGPSFAAFSRSLARRFLEIKQPE